MKRILCSLLVATPPFGSGARGEPPRVTCKLLGRD
jgi:hypothetical protein